VQLMVALAMDAATALGCVCDQELLHEQDLIAFVICFGVLDAKFRNFAFIFLFGSCNSSFCFNWHVIPLICYNIINKSCFFGRVKIQI
jgi:hypothetical protein